MNPNILIHVHVQCTCRSSEMFDLSRHITTQNHLTYTKCMISCVIQQRHTWCIHTTCTASQPASHSLSLQRSVSSVLCISLWLRRSRALMRGRSALEQSRSVMEIHRSWGRALEGSPRSSNSWLYSYSIHRFSRPWYHEQITPHNRQWLPNWHFTGTEWHNAYTYTHKVA